MMGEEEERRGVPCQTRGWQSGCQPVEVLLRWKSLKVASRPDVDVPSSLIVV